MPVYNETKFITTVVIKVKLNEVSTDSLYLDLLTSKQRFLCFCSIITNYTCWVH